MDQYWKLARSVLTSNFLQAVLGLVRHTRYQAIAPNFGEHFGSAKGRRDIFYFKGGLGEWYVVKRARVYALLDLAGGRRIIDDVSIRNEVVNATGFNVYAGNTLDSLLCAERPCNCTGSKLHLLCPV